MKMIPRRILAKALTSAASERRILHAPIFLQSSSSLYSTTATTKSTRSYTRKIKPQPSIFEPNDLNPPPPIEIERDWPRPMEIPWQTKVENAVNLIGHVAMPVQFHASSDGKTWAATILTQEARGGGDTLLWIPLIFEGDLAHIAACHLKEKDYVHVVGQLTGDPPKFNLKQGQTSIQVLVNCLNFVQDTLKAKENHRSHKQQEQETSHSSIKDSSTFEILWSDLLANPRAWWDNRLNKCNPTGSDFKHKHSGEELWIDDSTPEWILSNLESLNFTEKTVTVQKIQKSVNGVKDPENSWRDLVDTPNQWLDNRKIKLNGQVHPKYPDFKRKDSGVGLWLHSAPGWVLSELDRLKIDDAVLKPSQRDAGLKPSQRKDSKDNSWKSLVETPDKWWDNRSTKSKPKAPDFKHKETGEALWLSSSPAWVLPELPPVKSKDVATGDRETSSF